MCWIGLQENVNIQITDKDIEVYKVVLEADKQSCKSCIRGFIYEANTIYKIPSIQIEMIPKSKAYGIHDIFYVDEAYHSYNKIQFILKNPEEKYLSGYRKIIVGNRVAPLIKINNPYHVATFIIPKGSQYAINCKGEIISNQIIYTGKYLKL